MKTKTHGSVKSLVADTLGQEAVSRMEEHAQATRIAFALSLLRNRRGMTMREVAAKMGCSPSKVCRIEDGADAALAWGDIAAYADAVGMQVHLTFDDTTLPAAQRIKAYVFQIKKLLDQLAQIALDHHDDQKLVEKINTFYGEVLLNFLQRFGESYQKLVPEIVAGATGPECPRGRARAEPVPA